MAAPKILPYQLGTPIQQSTPQQQVVDTPMFNAPKILPYQLGTPSQTQPVSQQEVLDKQDKVTSKT